MLVIRCMHPGKTLDVAEGTLIGDFQLTGCGAGIVVKQGFQPTRARHK
jgi:hypothetical protein